MKRTPEELAELIIQKIQGSSQDTKEFPSNIVKKRLPKITEEFDPYEVRSQWIKQIPNILKQYCTDVSDVKIYSEDIGESVIVRLRLKGKPIYSLNIHKRGHFSGDEGISFYGTEGTADTNSGSTNASGSFKWSKNKNNVVLELHDLSLLDMFPNQKQDLTLEEFVDALWHKICDVIDRDY